MDRYGNVKSYDKESIKNKPYVKGFLNKKREINGVNMENLACMVYIIRENHKCNPENVYKSNEWLKIIDEENDGKKG